MSVKPQKRPARPSKTSGESNKKPKFDLQRKVKPNDTASRSGIKRPYQGNKNPENGSGDQPTVAEKVDWNKMKQEKKELRLKRKQTNDLYEVTARAKQIYEKLKCRATEKKDELCRELHSMLRGGGDLTGTTKTNYQKLVLAHDTARLVQCLLKHSPSEIRREISENLIPSVRDMTFSKYAHFCVSRMIKYGTPDIKQKVIDAMFGNIVKMCCQQHSATIVDTVYISWATAQQKAHMRQEFYGDLYKSAKNNEVKCIVDTYKETDSLKPAVLSAVKANLIHIVTKKLVDNSLIHSVLLDYLKISSDEDRDEMITAYSPFIPSLASTKDGVRASIICYWHSIVKDRRAILKSLREHLVKLCTHDHGHVLILAIINTTDDTKALKKSIFDPMFNEIQLIASNEWGRKIIEWFVVPDDTTLFHPQTIALLDEGLKYSKKDKEIRRTELLEAVQKPLLDSIRDNPMFWLRGGHTGLATAAIIKSSNNVSLETFTAMASVICDPNWTVNVQEIEVEKDEEKINIQTVTDEPKKVIKKKISPYEKKKTMKSIDQIRGVEHAGLHIVLKKILKLNKPEENRPSLGAAIATGLTEELVAEWLTMNRASFLLLISYESGCDATKERIKQLIQANLKILKEKNHAAGKLLIKNLNLKI